MRRINALGYNGINALATSTFASRRKRPRAPRRVPQPVPQRSPCPDLPTPNRQRPYSMPCGQRQGARLRLPPAISVRSAKCATFKGIFRGTEKWRRRRPCRSNFEHNSRWPRHQRSNGGLEPNPQNSGRPRTPKSDPDPT